MPEHDYSTDVIIPFEKYQIGSMSIQTVNARDLHAFLEVKTQYNHWIERRIQSYGFSQDIDFTVAILGHGPTRTIEHHVTIAMAKELSMVERTKRGKQARQYFIDCERRLSSAPTTHIATSPRETLDTLAACQDALKALGCFDDRDSITFAAYIRRIAATAMQPLLPVAIDPTQPPVDTSQPVLWTMSMRLQFLRYAPLSGKDGEGRQIRIGSIAAKNYKGTYKELPKKIWDFVKGQQRQVNAYPPERVHILDDAIETVLGPPHLQIASVK